MQILFLALPFRFWDCMQHDWKDTISGVHVSQLVPRLVRRGGITNHHLIAYSLSNSPAQNNENWLTCVEVIVCYISVVFLIHSVLTMILQVHCKASCDVISTDCWTIRHDCSTSRLRSARRWHTSSHRGLYTATSPAVTVLSVRTPSSKSPTLVWQGLSLPAASVVMGVVITKWDIMITK